MKALAIRTDKPQAELYLLDAGKIITEIKWQAHLKLAETLNSKIEEILNKLSINYKDIDAVAVYKGPGSFTGLRIGMSVANALAYSLDVPIVAADGADWLRQASASLASGRDDKVATPEYGSAARTTKPRK